MRYILALFVCFIFVSCNKEEKRNESNNSKDSAYINQALKEKSLQDTIKNLQEKIASLEKSKAEDKIKEIQEIAASKPSDSQLQKDFKNNINTKYRGYVKSTGFTKTNGIENDNGDGTYTIMFDGEMEGLKDDPLGGGPVGFGVRIGEKIKITGKMFYKKSENGWIVTNFNCDKKR